MDKSIIKEPRKMERNEVNTITNKKKVENQNQTHNVREEGIHPQNNRY